VVLGVKAKSSGKLGFLLTQFLVSKFADRSAALANHEPVTALLRIQAAPDESPAEWHLVRQIQAAQQVEYTIYGNVIEMFASGA